MTTDTTLPESVRKMIKAAETGRLTGLWLSTTGNELIKGGLKPDTEISAQSAESLQRDHDDISKLLEKFEQVAYYGNQYLIREDMENPKNGFDKSIGQLTNSKVALLPGVRPTITIGFATQVAEYTSRVLKLNDNIENGEKLQNSLFSTCRLVVEAIYKNALHPDDAIIFRNSVAAGLIELAAYGDVREGILVTDEDINRTFTDIGMPAPPTARLKATFLTEDYMSGIQKQQLEISYRDLIACGRLTAGLIHFLNQKDYRTQLDDLFISGEHYLERYLTDVYGRIREVVDAQFFDNNPSFEGLESVSSKISASLIFGGLDYTLLTRVLDFCTEHIEKTYSHGPNPLVAMQFCLVVIKRELARILKESKAPKKEKSK